MAVDFRYDVSKPSIQIKQGLKIYRTTLEKTSFFLLPGHAIFGTFVERFAKGLIGTGQIAIPSIFYEYMNDKHVPRQGSIIPSRRYVNPSSVVLEEYILTKDIIYNSSPPVDPSKPRTINGLQIPKFVYYPPLTMKPTGKIDVEQSLASFENMIMQWTEKQPPNKLYNEESIFIDPSLLPSFTTLNNQFGINWETIVLSYIVMVGQQQSPEDMRDTINKYVVSHLLTAAGLPLAGTVPPATTSTVTIPAPSKPTTSCNIVSGKAPMAQLICGQLNIGPQWSAILKGQVKCTQKGFAIADSLIKVAATRIFAIPEQSIMEPVVNSIDAYNPTRKVGKFGMGFFSLMYWIMRDPKATMSITSVYRHTGSPTPCGYKALISNLNGQLWVDVVETEPTLITSGKDEFFVKVNFGTPIDQAIIGKFIQQLNRLRYIPSAVINLNGDIVNSDGIASLSTAVIQKLPRVTVTLDSNGFSSDDLATGVPIEIFYGSLIVPSISSKTIVLSTRKDTGFVDRSRFEVKASYTADSQDSRFRVLVGDIVIMDLKLESLFTVRTIHLLTLPLNTRVPVSRDDVILSSVIDEARKSLYNLFLDCIDRPPGSNIDVGMLENGLKAFIAETASSENITILNEFLASIPDLIKSRNLVTVPPTSLYLELQSNTILGNAFVTSNNVDMKRLEDHIASISSNSILTTAFTNRQVIFLDGIKALKPADAGGTTSYLFVDRAWTVRSGPQWPSKLASEYKRVMLYPTGTAFATALSAPLQLELGRFKSDRVKSAATAMAGQYQLALNFREPGSNYSTQRYLTEVIPAMVLYFKVFYEPFMSESRLEQFITLVASGVARSDPQISLYGDTATIKAIGFVSTYLHNIFGAKNKRSVSSIDGIIINQSIMYHILYKSSSYSSDLSRYLVTNYSNDPRASGYNDPISKDLVAIITNNRGLFDKASFFMLEIYSYSIDLGNQFLSLNEKDVTPFTAAMEFNIPLEMALILTARNRKTGLDGFLFDIARSLLEESQHAYQYVLAYLAFYTLVTKLMTDGKIQSKQPNPRDMLTRIMDQTRPIEVARVLISATDNEFGSTPKYRMGSRILYLYINIGVGVIASNYNFSSFFQDLYKPALDVYGWIEKRLKVSSLVQEIEQGIPSTIPNCYSFTLSQMVSYAFQEEVPPTVIELFDAVSRHQSRVESKLQIIEIATNEGTSKNAIPGKLTETVQNALDAIRSANHPTVTIPNASIGILVKKIKGTNDMLLGINDPVGIPLGGIVALSIPFLSGKKASEIVTGEIGTGFFNVYRDAIGVFITTTVNGETTEILDTPIMDGERKRIIDIQRCARVIKTGLPNGTSIFIQSRHDDETFIPAAIEAITFTRDVVGLISEASMITLNKEPVSTELTKVYENDFFEFHMSMRGFSSYIMTKGVPFAPLYKYFTALGFFKDFDWLLDKFRTGVRLNVKAGVFTPVQTRTRIGLSDENTNILITSILQAFPFIILFQIEKKLITDDQVDKYFQYYSSLADANQMLPGPSDTNTWAINLTKLTSNRSIDETSRNEIMKELSRVAYPFMAAGLSHHKIIPDPSRNQTKAQNMIGTLASNLPGANLDNLSAMIQGAILTGATQFDDYPNLNNLLREGARGWPDIRKIQTILNAKFQEMRLSSQTFPGSIIWNLTYRWLMAKKKSERQKKTTVGADGSVKEEEEEQPKTTIKSPLHLPFCQVWINTYSRVAQKVIKNYPTKLPLVVFDLTINSNITGSYNPGLNVLTLTYNLMEGTIAAGKYKLDDIINVFSGTTDPSAAVLQLDINNSVWRSYFMPKGTIAHEMEHFRSGKSHDQGVHDAITMSLPYGGTKKRIFRNQHYDLMMSLVQAGLYDEVRKAWLQYKATGNV